MSSFSLSGGVEVLGFISPTDSLDTYAVIDPLYGIDGFRNVNLLSDLNLIPAPRRRAGMVVGVSGGTSYYKLNSSPWNYNFTDWSVFNTGGGGNLSGDYLPLSGGTVTGNTLFTLGLSANTISATTYQNLPIDIRVTGGTYSNGTTTFTNNTGGTFNVNGFYTGETSYVNSLTTGVGLSADTTTGNITIINTDPDQVVTISGGTGILTGGTYPNFTIENTLPDQVVTISGGTNVDVTGTYPNFNISLTGLSDNNIYTTGFTYSANTLYITDTSGNTFSTTIDVMTGLTINGDLTVTGTTSLQGFSATTISATTIGTSGDCIDDIYVSNIHSCSPLNINPLNEGNVYFGSTSAVTIDLTNNRVGIGTATPSAPLEIFSNQPNVAIPNQIKFSQAGGNIIFAGYSATISDFFGITLSTNWNQRPVRVAGSSGLYVGSTTAVPTPAGYILVEGNVGIGLSGTTAKLHVNNTTSGNTFLAEDSTNPDSSPFVIDASGNTGIGTTTPQARLDVRASGSSSTDIAFRVRNSAGTVNFLVVNGAGDVYNNGAGGISSNTFYGENVGRNNTGTFNTFIGYLAGSTSGTTSDSTFIGYNAGKLHTSGIRNTYVGSEAGSANTNGSQNTFIGRGAGGSIIGSSNTSVGGQSFSFVTTGSNNVTLGSEAGLRISTGTNTTTSNNSIFIGFDTRANADSQTNQIVIGHTAIGLGSNTTVIGNTGTTLFRPYGNVAIGKDSASEALDVSGKTKTISLQVTSGATTGYVLTSDASGNATWQVPTITADTYTTGFTYNNNTFTIGRNQGQPNLTATINTVTGLTVNGGLTVTGTSNLNGTITSSNLSGSTDRLVQVNSGGTFSATQEIISAYITSGGTAANQLENVSNWDINGNYTGSTITGTYQGQKHYDGNYFYEAVQDNIFIRLIRG